MQNTQEFDNNIVRQPADPVQYNNAEGILNYFGEANNFPLRLAKLVQDSPTASSCISTISDFIEGGAFSNPNIADQQINSQGLLFGDLHAGLSDSYAIYEGLAILVKYNKVGRITELYPVPFENCRLGKPDSKGVISKIKVNPMFGTSLMKIQETKEYDTYNPKPEVIQKQMARDGKKYLGQILYIGKPRPLSPFYARPHYISCEFWMGVDAAIGRFHKENLDAGFFQTLLIKMIGDENAPSLHPDDVVYNSTAQANEAKRTKAWRFNKDLQVFLGSKSKSKAMALWADNKDAAPLLEAFPSSGSDTLFTALQGTARENITTATKVPGILANIPTGATLGGDGNQIRAAVKLMQQRVVKIHGMFGRIYTDLAKNSVDFVKDDYKILHHNPFPELEIVDPQIWESLNEATKLNWIKKNTEIEIIEDVTPAAAPAAAPGPPENTFSNVLFTSYPEKVKANAQRARKFYDDTGKACGTRAGWLMCDNLIGGKPISYKDVKRIYNYLKKNETFKNYLFTDSCESVLYAAWGGDEMKDWAAGKINDTEK